MPRYSYIVLALALSASAVPHAQRPHRGHGGKHGSSSPAPASYSGGAAEPTAASSAFPSYPVESSASTPSATEDVPAPSVSSGGSESSDYPADDGTATTFAVAAASGSASSSTEPASSTEEPESSTEEPASSTEEPASSTEPAYSSTAPATTAAPSSGGSGGGVASGGDLPASSGTSVLDAVQTIAAGESFDGGMVMYDRGVSCTGQEEGGDSDAVFEIEDGGSLSNVIIGPNQIEGVHCYGACTLTNVWWSAVCEDAFTIKEQADGETTTITGGGAFGADDKILQHNGGGTLSVSGFTADTFGKLYRSCGNCDEMPERHVILDDITASDGSVLAGINSNYGDTATLSNIKVSDVNDVCVTYTGNDSGDEPEENGSGPSTNCIYSESDVSGE